MNPIRDWTTKTADGDTRTFASMEQAFAHALVDSSPTTSVTLCGPDGMEWCVIRRHPKHRIVIETAA